MKSIRKYSLILALLLIPTSLYFYFNCDKNRVENRWYTKQQVAKGEKIFLNNCATCHGKKAQKTVNWKKTLPDGSYPPPPLNGSAHAWHHSFKQYIEIITLGGKPYKGNMPAFYDTLTLEEKKAAISYFQSFWSDEIYNKWVKYDGLKGLE